MAASLPAPRAAILFSPEVDAGIDFDLAVLTDVVAEAEHRPFMIFLTPFF
jgi:hypothetical protein